MNQSQIAGLAGVTRQAVSKWFRQGRGDVQIRSTHLKALAGGLGVTSDLLLDDLLGLTDAERADLHARLLWDRAYPDLVALLLAAIDHQPRALGRLVEAMGLYQSAKVIGRSAWTKFPKYKRYLHPARRRGLEQLWSWRNSRTRA